MKFTTICLPLRIFGLEYESDHFFGFDFYELPGIILKYRSWGFRFPKKPLVPKNNKDLF